MFSQIIKEFMHSIYYTSVVCIFPDLDWYYA